MPKTKSTNKHHKPRNSKFQSIHEGNVTTTRKSVKDNSRQVMFHSRMSFYLGMFFGMIIVQVLLLSVLTIMSA